VNKTAAQAWYLPVRMNDLGEISFREVADEEDARHRVEETYKGVVGITFELPMQLDSTMVRRWEGLSLDEWDRIKGGYTASVNKTATRLHCNSCGHEFTRNGDPFKSIRCPKCKSNDLNNAGLMTRPMKPPKGKTAMDGDGTEYGVWGDHCPHCGNDWKQPCDPDCLRNIDPDAARRLEEAASKALQIAEGIKRTNPGMSTMAAFELAERTIERFPAVLETKG
jgi:hypothetical protein